ncbi:MAG: ATP-binding protein [Phycisphaerales bacterium]
MNAQPDIRVHVVSDPTYLSGVRDLIAAVARRLSFSDDTCGQIALAVDEALANVIRHGYERRKDGPITISIWPLPGDNGHSRPGIRIVVEDEARQVDPGEIKSRDLDQIRPGGLGVHIIRQIMDEVVYEKRDGPGMRLTLVKRIPADAGKPGAAKPACPDCVCAPPASPAPQAQASSAHAPTAHSLPTSMPPATKPTGHTKPHTGGTG